MRARFILLAGAAVALLLESCGSGENPIDSAPGSTVRGTITTGVSVPLASQTIPPGGGTITIDRPGDPLDGFVLHVPSGAYRDSRTFTLSYAPIIDHTFGDLVDPITPLFEVHNGGGVADSMMLLRVPASVPAGHFPMGFYYDDSDGSLTPMPLFDYDSASVIVGAPHFSEWFITAVDKRWLDRMNLDSKFVPGQDDWQFPNSGSYVAPAGHCSGQAMSAIWYFTRKVKSEGKPHLQHYGGEKLYDNYRHPLAEKYATLPAHWKKTPQNWEDDVCAYRLASMVQKDHRGSVTTTLRNMTDIFGSLREERSPLFEILRRNASEGTRIDRDELTWYEFKYAMAVNKDPQWIGVKNDTTGHALIVYKIIGNRLYIADPNWPGRRDRVIDYDSTAKRFTPYVSGPNRAQKNREYPNIYFGNISWLGGEFDETMEKRWKEFEEGTIGSDKFPKPTVTLMVYKEGQRDPDLVTVTEGSHLVLPRITEYVVIKATIPHYGFWQKPCNVDFCEGFSGTFHRDPANDNIVDFRETRMFRPQGRRGRKIPIGIYINVGMQEGNSIYNAWLDFIWIEIEVR